MIEPTSKQIQNCELSGWHYIGDGFFVRGDELGWFTKAGFVRE